jgi:hypothetical protein
VNAEKQESERRRQNHISEVSRQQAGDRRGAILDFGLGILDLKAFLRAGVRRQKPKAEL